MLYKDVHSVLVNLKELLDKSNLRCPEEIDLFIRSLNNCLEVGRKLSKDEIESIKPYLFPESGMGWLNDLQYDMNQDSKLRLQDMMNQFYTLWYNS